MGLGELDHLSFFSFLSFSLSFLSFSFLLLLFFFCQKDIYCILNPISEKLENLASRSLAAFNFSLVFAWWKDGALSP
jgi:hypothetical protein